ncbi:hypothetical protein [uncultured Brachyspira sp.]|nr:hypothetical protein [uncultured Brachyspira sp.]
MKVSINILNIEEIVIKENEDYIFDVYSQYIAILKSQNKASNLIKI